LVDSKGNIFVLENSASNRTQRNLKTAPQNEDQAKMEAFKNSINDLTKNKNITNISLKLIKFDRSIPKKLDAVLQAMDEKFTPVLVDKILREMQ
jgi:transcriptional regulator of heat shock response